jgi:electron transfer flavoprotein alpha/beta subunit
MGIRKASRASIPVLGSDDLEIGPSSTTRWTDLDKQEPERVQVRIFEGDSVEEKAAQLADALMAEKVI